MGFSASQARYLALTNRMSDIEFQGQQINQQRTSLSNASSTEYGKLQDMVVPVPPSVLDFKKIEYTFQYGTTPTTLGTVRPNGDRFTVEFLQQRVGNYLDNAGNILVNSTDNGYEVAYDGGTRQLHSLASVTGPGQPISSDELAGYIDGFKHSHPEYAELDEDDIIAMLSVYFENVDVDDEGVETPRNNSPVNFIMNSDLQLVNSDGSSWVPQYECIPNGTYTYHEMIDNCGLTFDPSNGRILSIEIPGDDGVLRSYSLEASEVTDNDAYETAFNQYEFEKYQYDKKQQDINNTMKVIEEQDKKLQLKLTRLDNERNAVNTEMEAVKKVIQDNIDKSFKSFGG